MITSKNCECSQYEDVALIREEVTRRIKHTKKLKKRLDIIAVQAPGEHKLLKCATCGQHWQLSRAWNWGNYEYLFKVPIIRSNEWQVEPYVQPDELLIYSAVMDDFINQNRFIETERVCRADSCTGSAIKYSGFCLNHHIESLQTTGALLKKPIGKSFAPYDDQD